MTSSKRDILGRFFRDHDRTWRENRYVYPVISRRSGGISIGVNLNPDKACNFDCVYCQVDRSVPPVVRTVDPQQVRDELELTLQAVLSGCLFEDEFFKEVPASHRRLNDIAFSGDGEPTTSPQFASAVRIAADVRRSLGLSELKLVLITDAAYLDRPLVKEGLAILDANQGEIWAKLDAGTEEYYQLINRPNVPLQQVLDNILEARARAPARDPVALDERPGRAAARIGDRCLRPTHQADHERRRRDQAHSDLHDRPPDHRTLGHAAQRRRPGADRTPGAPNRPRPTAVFGP